jgi:hypothetical protein
MYGFAFSVPQQKREMLRKGGGNEYGDIDQ